MSAEFTCDGCGAKAPAANYNGNWFKPDKWFERSDEDGIQTACSRPCIDIVAEKTGKSAAILPF